MKSVEIIAAGSKLQLEELGLKIVKKGRGESLR